MIRFADLTPSLWPNGAGRKADIATSDGWLIGFAWLERDAPFSDLTGIDRTITLVRGSGFALHFPPTESADLVIDRLHMPTPFDGGWPTHCTVRGPCVVLNAYTARNRFRHSVEIVTAPVTIDPQGTAVTVAVALDGDAALDALVITEATEPEVRAGTRLAVIRIFEKL